MLRQNFVLLAMLLGCFFSSVGFAMDEGYSMPLHHDLQVSACKQVVVSSLNKLVKNELAKIRHFDLLKKEAKKKETEFMNLCMFVSER